MGGHLIKRTVTNMAYMYQGKLNTHCKIFSLHITVPHLQNSREELKLIFTRNDL